MKTKKNRKPSEVFALLAIIFAFLFLTSSILMAVSIIIRNIGLQNVSTIGIFVTSLLFILLGSLSKMLREDENQYEK